MSDPTVPDPVPQPAEAGPPAPAGRGTRRTALVVLVALVVSALLGGGAFAVYTVFFNSGPRPADVLPDSTVAVLSIDLDPSAGQKIEALKTLRKFPRLQEDLGLDPTDDLRQFIVEKALDCEGIDFETDVKPWIGKRAAIAAVDLGGDAPVPVLALQITDQKKADAGFEDLATCAEQDLGYLVGTDYLIASDTGEHAQAVLAAGKQKSLADTAKYQTWTDAAGDQGVLNFYLADRAADYLIDGLEALAGEVAGFGGAFGGTDSFSYEGGGLAGQSAPAAATCPDVSDDPFAVLKDQLDDFDGLAGAVRFADGGMELSVATSGIGQFGTQASVGEEIGSLPADTAMAAGFSIPQDYARDLVDQLTCGAGDGGEDLVAEAEAATGLQLPEDLADLLGSAVTFSVGGDAPADLDRVSGPADLPLALALHGETGRIEAALAKIEKHRGADLEEQFGASVQASDSLLVVSGSAAYADLLLGAGGLGDSEEFQEAVPEAEKSVAIFYLDFDSAWRTALLDLAGGLGLGADDLAIADENTKALKSLGVSTWVEDGASHVLVKLATR